MRDIKLYIENQEVDIVNLDAFAEQFAFTYTFNDLYEPDKVTDTYSKQIGIPGTSRNNRIFGQAWSLDSEDLSSFDPCQIHTYRLMMNGFLWKTGSVKLDAITVRGSVITYTITLYGNMTGFMTEMLNGNYEDEGNKLLCSLPFAYQLRHTVNASQVWNRAQSPTLDSYGGLTYIPCNNGLYDDFDSEKWLTKDSNGNAVVAPVHFSSSSDDGGGVKWDEYQLNEYRSYYQRPAIRVKTMLDLIASSETNYDFGYEDSSFFSDSNPYYSKTYMTCDRYSTDADSDVMRISVPRYWDTVVTSTTTSTSRPYTRSNLYAEIPVQSVDGAYAVIDDEGYIDCSAMPAGTRKLGIEFEAGVTFKSSNSVFTDHGTIRLSQPINVTVVARTDNGREYSASPYASTDTVYDAGNNASFFYENNGRKDLFVRDSYNVPFTAYLQFTAEKQSYPTWVSDNYYMYKPMRQVIDISQIDRKFKLYIKVSNLSDLAINYTGYASASEYTLPIYFNFRRMRKISDSGTNYSLAGQYGFTGTDVTFDYSENVRTGVVVSKEKILGKEMTQGEFLLRYSKLFGLIYDTDRDGRIRLKTRNKFFEGYRILDWSDKVDHSEEISINPLTFDTKTLSMKYEDGKTYYEDKYRARTGIDYGEQRINTGYPYNSDTTDLIEDNFTNTVMSRDENEWIGTIGGVSTRHQMGEYVLPAYYKKGDDGREPADIGRTLLFYKGTQAVSDGKYAYVTDDSSLMYDTAIGGSEDPCWYDYDSGLIANCRRTSVMPLFTTLYSKRVSLDIGYPTVSYAGETPSTYSQAGTLYSRFWANYIGEIYSKRAKTVTMQVRLTPDDIYNFSFRDFVVIDNVLYHPNKITDLNPLSEGTTEVEFIKVVNIENYINGQDTDFS